MQLCALKDSYIFNMIGYLHEKSHDKRAVRYHVQVKYSSSWKNAGEVNFLFFKNCV